MHRHANPKELVRPQEPLPPNPDLEPLLGPSPNDELPGLVAGARLARLARGADPRVLDVVPHGQAEEDVDPRAELLLEPAWRRDSAEDFDFLAALGQQR